MYKVILLLLLPLSTLMGQSPTSWKVYELFSEKEIPVNTEQIQHVLPGFSIYEIQSNDRKASLHALIDAQQRVNALIFQSPDYKNRMTRLVIPTPNSAQEIIRIYRQDRSFKLSETQQLELLDLIANFSIIAYQDADRPDHFAMVADAFEVKKEDKPLAVSTKGGEMQAAKAEVLTTKVHPSCKIELSNRQIVQQEEIEQVFAQGTVTLKLCVNENGTVDMAKFTQRGSTTLNEKLIEMAKNNATSLKFNPGSEDSQCGTITYFFNQ